MAVCRQSTPPLFQTGRHRVVACFLYQEAPTLPAHQMATAFVEPPAPSPGGPRRASAAP
jgi:hypothetical protein